MAQIGVASLKNGTTFEEEGQPFRVLKYSHVKVGRGHATIRVKAQNLKTGTVIEKTYHSGGTVQAITTQKRPLQYLYKDSGNFISSAGEKQTLFIFMNPHTYEQVPIGQNIIGEQEVFLKEGENINILFWDKEETGATLPLGLDLPPKMTFTVTEAPPGVKGNSAINLFKPAKLDNGMQVKVPLFIKVGEKVRVDTRTAKYVERA